MLSTLYWRGLRFYLRPVLVRESRRSRFDAGEKAFEYELALRTINREQPRAILDVGTGVTSWPHLLAGCGFATTAIDKVEGYWEHGLFNRHYLVHEDDITRPKLGQQFDLITCFSVLQHIPATDDAVRGLFELLVPGGVLVLAFVYDERRHVDNVYALPGSGYRSDYPTSCQVSSRADVDRWVQANRGELVEQEYYRVFSGELWTFGERLARPQRVAVGDPHHKTAMVIRKPL